MSTSNSVYEDKLPLSISQLIINTDKVRKDRSSKIKIVNIQHKFVLNKLNHIPKNAGKLSKLAPGSMVVFIKYIITTENMINGHRYTVILSFPYMKNMKYRKIKDLPVQVYSSTADFKYRFAYNLNQIGNLYYDDQIKLKLGIAMTEPPKVVKSTVPIDSKQCDKHLYHVLENIPKIIYKTSKGL